MQLTPQQQALAEIFFPQDMAARKALLETNGRLVHYTTAEVAFSILRERAVWMRNAVTMNDYSEIQHGVNALIGSYKSEDVGEKFKKIVNQIHDGFSAELESLFDGWLPRFQSETFLTCLSEHDPAEDELGRLSMWRAYGGRAGIALVVRNTPFSGESSQLGAYSSKVAYLDESSFKVEFNAIVENMLRNLDLLRVVPRGNLIQCVFSMMRFAVLATKHPGFKEEREWCVIYSPTLEKSTAITKDIAVIHGVPQEIYKIPLENTPENGLVGADVPSFLERIIMGPTSQPLTLYQTFVSLLNDWGVENAGNKVIHSNIPLRQQSD